MTRRRKRAPEDEKDRLLAKRKSNMVRTKRRQNHKKVNLSPDEWVRNQTDVKALREELEASQEGLCACTGEKLRLPCLDHDHDNGRVRGVISGFTNTLEGRFKSLYTRFAKAHTKLSYPDYLIAMGMYLQHDTKYNPLHYKQIQDLQTKCRAYTVDRIRNLIFQKYAIVAPKLTKTDLIYILCCLYRNELEEANGGTPNYKD